MTTPDPLVPAEVDLREFQYMELDVRRLRDSRFAAQVSAEAFRAGLLLWCAAWHQVPAASVADDDIELANLCGYGRFVREFQKVKTEALHGWVLCNDGRWYHPVVAEKALAAWRSKLQHAYGKLLERIRKANKSREQQHLPSIQMPTFEDWNAGGRRDPVPPERRALPPEDPGASGGTPPTLPAEHPGRGGGKTPENALRGNGTERNRTDISEKQQAASSPPPSRAGDSGPPAGPDIRPSDGTDPPPPVPAVDPGDTPAVPHNPAPATRLGRVCNLLRQAGVRCGPGSAGIADLAADPRITDELIVEALVGLNERGKGTFGAPVVLLRVHDLLKAADPARARGNPASEFPAWRTDPQQCDRLGSKLGLRANAGEEYPQYRQRIAAELARLREKVAA